ncbi:arginase family protein [Campylobacter sp. VicNov18]|uniref:formimidoylglutamase n=1 Tax=Campylobacter bilis TaxID=2691918 RepID=UPI00187B69DD|nr:formimidoylglutamase [Campylobacter bilis]MBM0637443.1 formimidoylglutamase [Campylobacter bilis]MCC8278162.1 arginase family protein [Campylobacter bilis]MCC8299666.1 arginase family protein [Campylobacter bilis]MCC8301071.1 arginase family protein [Campylobacter bilis]MCC8350200.1 arginase family protein [Campylobacter bilis]
MWQGRNDGEEACHKRLFQCLNKNSNNKLLGFCSSLGVQRNHGRIGSELAPKKIRENMVNFAIHDDFDFDDLGDIENFTTLEMGQDLLYHKCLELLKNNHYAVILGGGHETSLGSIKALLDHKKQIGIINFDAHFDVRIQQLHSSGNSFYKAYEYAQKNHYNFSYLCLGASKISNTKALFQTMQNMKAQYVLDNEFEKSQKMIEEFLEQNEFIYLSIDIDVFSQNIAPAVSAPAIFGISLKEILPLLKLIFNSKKVFLADICEFNPKFDIDNHTAKLVAYLTYFLLSKGNL